MESLKELKIALAVAVMITAYGFISCYPYIAFGYDDAGFKTVYCKLSFFQFSSNSFLPVSLLVHFLIWVTLSLLGKKVFDDYFGRYF